MSVEEATRLAMEAAELSGELAKKRGREKVSQTRAMLTQSQERLEATERRHASILQQNKAFEAKLQEQREEGDDIEAYLTMKMKGSDRLGHMEEIDTIGREKIIAAHQRRLHNLNKEREATEQYLEEQLEEVTREVVEAEEDLKNTIEVSFTSIYRSCCVRFDTPSRLTSLSLSLSGRCSRARLFLCRSFCRRTRQKWSKFLKCNACTKSMK